MRRVGVLMGIAESDPAQQSLVSAFAEALQGLGWHAGRNIRIDYRWGAGDADKIRGFARELVEQKPDLIVGHNARGRRPQAADRHDPDRVHAGLRPNPATSPNGGSYFLDPVEAAAPLLKLAPIAAPVHSAAEIEPIMVSLAHQPNTGLIVMPDIFILAHREQIITLADKYRMPAAYAYRLFPASGGLMSYGTDLADLFRRAAPNVDRILKGGKPADLPVQTPTKYELVLNLKTAKALGLDVPLSVQQRADEVIE